MAAAKNTVEQSSLSNYAVARVTSLHIDWTAVDFAASALRGTVTYKALAVKNATELVLDTNHLVVKGCKFDGAQPHGPRDRALSADNCPAASNSLAADARPSPPTRTLVPLQAWMSPLS